MTISKKVLNYLKKAKVKFDVVKHKKVYTAFDLAKTLKEKMDRIAKTVLVKVDNNYALVVLPASHRLDTEKLKKLLKVKKVELAKELSMAKVLKVKAGALTPFGSLHKLAVYLDKTLTRVDKLLVGAGSHTESLRMRVNDLSKLENMTLGSFGEKVLQKLEKGARKSTKKKK